MSDEFHFGRFRLDPANRVLMRDGAVLQPGSRALDILCVLAAAKGEIVSKNDLMAQVWRGLTVEESNVHVHVSALRKVLDDEKNRQSHVVTIPGRGYRLIGLDTAPVTTPVESSAERPLAVPDLPSIAVLPFSNLSEDPAQDYFADGIVEEIITALSRLRWLFVIARNSSFTFKGRAVDVKQVGRDLGVRYVLEGSVRKAGSKLRITGQLIDAGTGVHLWADRFDGELEDIFRLQDQVTTSVVGAIAPKLEQAEIKRVARKPIASLDAYDCHLRGMASVYRWTNDSNSEALRLFYKAIELDPHFATPYGMAGWCYVWRQLNGWTKNRTQDVAESVRLVRHVAQSGNDDAVALSFGGLALGYVVGDLDGGSALIDRALVLNPNLAAAWHASGWVRAFLHETDVALEHLTRAMRMSPLDPLMFSMQQVTSLAYFVAGQYAEAASWAEKSLREQPNSLATIRLLAGSYALLGRVEDARAAMAQGLRLDPKLRISNIVDRVGPYRSEDLAIYADALRTAGVPE